MYPDFVNCPLTGKKSPPVKAYFSGVKLWLYKCYGHGTLFIASCTDVTSIAPPPCKLPFLNDQRYTSQKKLYPLLNGPVALLRYKWLPRNVGIQRAYTDYNNSQKKRALIIDWLIFDCSLKNHTTLSSLQQYSILESKGQGKNSSQIEWG